MNQKAALIHAKLLCYVSSSKCIQFCQVYKLSQDAAKLFNFFSHNEKTCLGPNFLFYTKLKDSFVSCLI